VTLVTHAPDTVQRDTPLKTMRVTVVTYVTHFRGMAPLVQRHRLGQGVTTVCVHTFSIDLRRCEIP
jgi:hypothetical protein